MKINEGKRHLGRKIPSKNHAVDFCLLAVLILHLLDL
jgi:hypothetical protein